jgi:hypothetical protein
MVAQGDDGVCHRFSVCSVCRSGRATAADQTSRLTVTPEGSTTPYPQRRGETPRHGCAVRRSLRCATRPAKAGCGVPQRNPAAGRHHWTDW